MVAYNRDIPDTPNNPSVDQPKMKQNTNAIDDLISVDHLTFQATNFGTHKQTAFENFSAGTLPGGTPASVAYPAAGVDVATTAQYYFKNPSGNYILSGVKAFANFVVTVGAISATNDFNISSINKASAGSAIVITLTANTLSSNNAVVFITKGTSVLGYSLAGDVITTDTTTATGTVNLLVLQA